VAIVRRSQLAWIVFVVSCRPSHAPYDQGVITAQLVAAGYSITPAPLPKNLLALPSYAGVIDVSCIDAVKGGKTDTLCVVKCRDGLSCGAASEHAGETYGVMQSGATLFVHQQCAIDPAWKPGSRTPSFDCTEARRAIGIL
jgi:hypothetical protein